MIERISFHDQIYRNKLKSVFLLLIVFFVLVALGYVIGMVVGPEYFTIIMIAAIVISIVYIWVCYYYSHSIALASVNAREASTREYFEYHNIVEGLCLASGLPKPKLYVMQDSHINAFASGRDPRTAIICVTSGTLEKLDKQELEGVLAHELSHVANYDIRFMTLTAVLVGMIAILSEIFLRSLWYSSLSNNRDRGGKVNAVFIIVGIVLAILAPILVQLVQLAISRRREYTADASAVKFVRSPTGLMKALRKIEREHAPTNEEKHHYNKATAPLFMSDPFKRKMTDLFSTHPPLEKRIALLERM